MHPKSVVSPARVAAYLLFASVAFLGSTSLSSATPSEAIARAVYTNGAAEVTDAKPEQILTSYTAVVARLKIHQLPDYVTAAISLRPDLSAQITACSIRAAVRNAQGRQILETVVARVVRAAVTANPDAALTITAAAVAAAPALRDRIVAAAGAAAADARLTARQVTARGPSFAASFRGAAGGEDFSVGYS
ncbi:MAG: hypothetical protein M3Y69_08330, partial [Verrucomicrobiota bacterium]|nr:hypothetical protein [Verrucomicrobiota bacterium]